MSVCREKVLAHVVHGQRGRPLSPVTASEADGERALLVVGVVLADRAVSLVAMLLLPSAVPKVSEAVGFDGL